MGAVLAGGVVPGHLAGEVAGVGLKGGVVKPVVVSLARGGMRMLIAAKRKLVVAMVLVAGVVTGVGGILLAQVEGVKPVAGGAKVVEVVASVPMPATVPGMISGVVVDAGGKVVGGAFVSVVDWEGATYGCRRAIYGFGEYGGGWHVCDKGSGGIGKAGTEAGASGCGFAGGGDVCAGGLGKGYAIGCTAIFAWDGLGRIFRCAITGGKPAAANNF